LFNLYIYYRIFRSQSQPLICQKLSTSYPQAPAVAKKMPGEHNAQPGR